MKTHFSAFIFSIVFVLTGCRERHDSLPPVILLEQQVYETVAGETVTVTPEYENCGEGTAWLWTCDGETLSVEPSLTFTSDEAGEYYIMLTVSNSVGEDKAELFLIAVRPDYQGLGVNALFFADLIPVYNRLGFTRAETGPQLESNVKELSQWKPLNPTLGKRRRCYGKAL